MSEAVSAPALCTIEYVPLDPGYSPLPSISSHDSNQITIVWQEATGCGGVEDLECEYIITVSEDGNLRTEDVTATQYTLFRPVAGIKYCFDVTPCNRCGMGIATVPLCVHHEFCQTPIAVGLPVIEI
jgi:hypothetical protein